MTKLQKVILVLLFALTCFFGLYKLTESPSFVYDEGWYFQTSANLAREGVDGLRMSPAGVTHISTFVTVGYPLIFPLALWFKIFSVGIFQARFFMFLILLAFTLVSYFLSKKLYGNKIALASFALLATFPPLYGNGKTVMGETPGLLFLVLFLLSLVLVRLHSNKKLFFIISSGIFAGLCVAVKPFFILLLPALFVGVVIEFLRKELTVRETGIGVISVLVPIIAWFLIQFRGEFSITETLNYYANPYNLGNIYDVIWANLKGLFTDVGTLYTVILMVVWGGALILRVKNKIKIHVAEITAFIFSLLVMLAYLRTSGMYRYFYPAQAISLIFFPYSAFYISEIISRKISIWKGRAMFFVMVILLSILGIYQLGFDSWVASAYSSHKTAELHEYFSKVSTSTSVLFYNTPEVVPFIRGTNYYQFIINYYGPQGGENIDKIKEGEVDMVITQTVLFNENENNIFARYKEKEQIYKYSVLEKIKKP